MITEEDGSHIKAATEVVLIMKTEKKIKLKKIAKIYSIL